MITTMAVVLVMVMEAETKAAPAYHLGHHNHERGTLWANNLLRGQTGKGKRKERNRMTKERKSNWQRDRQTKRQRTKRVGEERIVNSI